MALPEDWSDWCRRFEAPVASLAKATRHDLLRLNVCGPAPTPFAFKAKTLPVRTANYIRQYS